MGDRKEKNVEWLSVPQFGDWDQKGDLPDYSMDFSKIREMRKQNKGDISRSRSGAEEGLKVNHKKENHHRYHRSSTDRVELHPHGHSPTMRKSLLSYFNCCIKA
ncbi:hypothetical protein NE237_027935 [Protea cynaroides]|uniref:RIN4 pathogenic type III effector avirulence factor Avr cleavage site domain-containing protein n=1 Tax=Protea cynaroides TaxID=273540 RepID=A0A9Q0GNY1_9MAGN|nr:hypothetical protein NE237_027935 [Protea cynaroides]